MSRRTLIFIFTVIGIGIVAAIISTHTDGGHPVSGNIILGAWVIASIAYLLFLRRRNKKEE